MYDWPFKREKKILEKGEKRKSERKKKPDRNTESTLDGNRHTKKNRKKPEKL